MKYNLSAPLIDRDGNPITEPMPGSETPRALTIATMLVRALDAGLDSDKNSSPDDARKRFVLGARILETPAEVELSHAEVVILQDRITKCFASLVSGQCILALDKAIKE